MFVCLFVSCFGLVSALSQKVSGTLHLQERPGGVPEALPTASGDMSGGLPCLPDRGTVPTPTSVRTNLLG